MKRKLVLLGLIVVFGFVSIFTGCVKKDESQESTTVKQQETKKQETTKAKDSSNLTEPGTFPIVKEKVKLTIYKWKLGEKENLDTNPFTIFYEKMTNVDFEWITAPPDRFKEKMNLMFSSGDVADIIATGNHGATLLSKVEESSLAAEGLIIPLNDLIDTQSVWLKEILVKRPEVLESITSPDGKIYNMPGINSTVEVRKASLIWINIKWLENLGLEVPTTTDEYYNVLKAFKEKDANGNGDPNDEIPLGGWSGLQYGAILSSFGPNTLAYIDKGVVKTSVDKPFFREALRYLKKLYDEGLLFRECFTIDRSSFSKINLGSDIAKIGSMAGVGHTLQFAPPETGLHLQYAAFVLDGPNGRKCQQISTHISNGISSNCVITSNCKHPEVAFRVLDWLYSEEGTLWTTLGPEGVAWKKAEPGAVGLDGRPAKYEKLPVTQDNEYFGNLSWTMAFGSNYDYDFIMSIAYPKDPYENNPAAYEKYLYYNSSKWDKILNFDKTSIPNLYYAPEDLRVISHLQTQVNDYVNQCFAQFILGKMDLDNDWDEYLNTLEKKAGLSLYLEILQRNYDKSAFAKK